MNTQWYSKFLTGLVTGLALLSLSINPAQAAAMPAIGGTTGKGISPATRVHLPDKNLMSVVDSPAVCPASIGFGETIQCTIASAGEVDNYTFTASAGDMILVRMSKSAGALWPGIRVFSQGGTKLCEANSTDSVSAEVAGCTFPSPGTYTIQAYDGLYGVYTGTYYLYLQRLNNPGSPVAIAYGQTLPSAIALPAIMDTYTFTGSAGDRVLVRVGESSGTLWPGTRIYAPDGTKLCQANSGDSVTTEIATCTLSSPGTYTILAYGSSYGASTGGYYICLQRLNNPGSPVSISYGQTMPGSIPTAAKIDSYSFLGDAGDKVLVRMGEASGTLWPGLRIYGPDGTKLCQADSSNSVTIEIATCTLTSTGIHTILAYGSYGYEGFTGGYYINLQRLNNPDSPGSISFGQTLPGSIPTAAKMDSYTFAGNVGDKVLVRMGQSSGTLWPGLRVYGPDGSKLCQADSGDSVTTEIATCTLTSTGTHTILAYGSYGYEGFTGGYYIYLQRLNNPGSPGSISYGQTLPGSIPSPAEMDTYIFAGHAGNLVSLRMIQTSGTLWPRLRIYGPDGVKLCQADSSDSVTTKIAACTLTSTGTHTILAYSSYGYGAYIGNYSITLDKILWIYLPLMTR